MTPSRRLTTSITGLLLLLPASPALSAWPHHPAINVPILTGLNAPGYPFAATDGVGGAVVAWHDSRSGTSDIFAHRVLASGAVHPAWPVNGQVVCNAANQQYNPVVVPDGAGGAILAWSDFRNGAHYDLYVHHVLASGSVDPAWPVNGRLVSGAAWTQSGQVLTSDGAGGAIVAWQDLRSGNYDVYAQRVLASGAIDPAWPADGRLISNASGDQSTPAIAPDGAGGALLAWVDTRAGNNDIYAHRVLASGAVDPAWTANGRPICAAAGSQLGAQIVSDGTGGGIVVWMDLRGGVAYDIYAHHILSQGETDPYWSFGDGLAVCTAANWQSSPKLVGDGAGGAYVAWVDGRGTSNDIYATHLTASGALEAGWVANGNVVCSSVNSQENPAIVSDGVGGAIVVWDDQRSNTRDVYAGHLLAGGVDASWPSNGRAVCTAANNQYAPTLVADADGGAIAAYLDFRNHDDDGDIYAQRVARFGYLGSPEPVIVGVDDVPNDQGGVVKLSWDASYLDTNNDANLAAYDILRSVPEGIALARLARGARVVADPIWHVPGADELIVTTVAQTTYYWEFLDSRPPLHYVSGYSYLASTTGDSTAAGNPATAFMIVARNAANTMWWLSAPATGHSVDDLAPAAPAPFAGQYGGGGTHLHWDPNTETDLAGYRLYRGSNAGFVPGPGNLVSAQPDTGYHDPGPAGSWYKLSAVDLHGNESPYATLSPGGTLDAGTASGGVLAFAAPAPNPARASATFAITLPRAMAIRLAIYDASGRRVRSLRDGVQPAGELSIPWDLRDDAGGGVTAGLYFARLEAEGTTLLRRMVAIR